jgi:hypothetical protein
VTTDESQPARPLLRHTVMMRITSVAAAFAAVWLLTGCSGSGSGSGSTQTLPTMTPRAAAHRTATPAGLVDTSLWRCAPALVAISMNPTGHVVDNHDAAYVVRFRNRSQRACALQGYPYLRLTRTSAPRSWTRVDLTTRWPYPPIVAGSTSALDAESVAVAAGGAAYAYLVIDWGAECGASQSAELRVGVSSASATLIRSRNVGVCRGDLIDLSPYTAVHD